MIDHQISSKILKFEENVILPYIQSKKDKGAKMFGIFDKRSENLEKEEETIELKKEEQAIYIKNQLMLQKELKSFLEKETKLSRNKNYNISNIFIKINEYTSRQLKKQIEVMQREGNKNLKKISEMEFYINNLKYIISMYQKYFGLTVEKTEQNTIAVKFKFFLNGIEKKSMVDLVHSDDEFSIKINYSTPEVKNIMKFEKELNDTRRLDIFIYNLRKKIIGLK